MTYVERTKDTAGLIDTIYGDDPRKTEPLYRYVRDHPLGAHVLRLTGRSYGGYELSKVPTPKPTLALLFSGVRCLSISTSLLGHR